MASKLSSKSGINPKFSVKSRTIKELDYYLNGLMEGNRYILSECITLIESTQNLKRDAGIKLLSALPKSDKKSIRIGITGSPGVGKSTFIETFGLFLIENGHNPSILAIDPSSQINKGSILGDKTRMETLANHPKAFIRPSASGNILGGTAAFTKDAIRLCEAAGYDFILVETVGIGQSEIEVDNITDVNVLLLQPGAGDDIQGIKRGVVENADILIINKADGQQLDLAKQTMRYYKNAIQLFHHDTKGWSTPVLMMSAIENTGIKEVYQAINDYQKCLTDAGIFQLNRQRQEMKWFEKQCDEMMHKIVFSNNVINKSFNQLSKEVRNNKISTSAALAKMEVVFNSMIKSN
jgi:LAO/AO transport system kinase